MDAPTPAREEWLRRFVDRLVELRPATRPEEAVDVASVAFDSANDLDPQDAAGVFAEVLDARVPVHDLKRWAGRKQGLR